MFAQTLTSYETGVEGQTWQQLPTFGRGIDAGNERPITTALLFPAPAMHGGIADVWPCTTTPQGFAALCYSSGVIGVGPGVAPDTAQNYGGRFAPCVGNQCYASGLIGVGPATRWAVGPCVMRNGANGTDCYPSEIVPGTKDANGVLLDPGARVPPADGQLAGPLGIAVDKTSGTIYVTDHWNHRVQAFLFNGAVVSLPNPIGDGIPGIGAFIPAGAPANATGERLNFPESIEVDAARNILVGDGSNGRVAVFDPTGKLLESLAIFDPNPIPDPTPADPTHTLPNPAYVSGIALTPGASYGGTRFGGAPNPPGALLVVSDKSNCTVYMFDATTLQRVGLAGGLLCFDAGAQQVFSDISGVDGVSVDAAGHIFAADYYRDRVEIFDRTGAFITAFGDPLDGAAAPFAMHGPTDVMVDHRGVYTETDALGGTHQVARVWVVDSTNQRLAVYKINFDQPIPVATFLFDLNAAGDLNGFPTKIAEDMSTDPVGKIVTTDPGNARIQRFQVPDLAVVNVVGNAVTRTVTFDVFVPAGKELPVTTVTPTVCPTTPNTTVSSGVAAGSAGCRSLSVTASLTPGNHTSYTFDFVTGQNTASFDIVATGNVVNNIPQTTSNTAHVSVTTGCPSCTVTPQVLVSPGVLEALTPPVDPSTLYVGARTYAAQVSLRITATSQAGLARIFFKFTAGPELANISSSGLAGIAASGNSGFIDVPFRLAGTSTIEFWATSVDGTETAHRSAELSLDLTPPDLTFHFDRMSSASGIRANDPAGWWNEAVSLPMNFTGNITEVTPLGAFMAANPALVSPLTFTTEGRGLAFRVTVTARSGLTTTQSTNDPLYGGQAVNVDMTPPTFVAGPAIVLERTSYQGAPPPLNSPSLATDPSLSDGTAGSGVKTVVPTSAVTNFSYGSGSVSFTATDVAGNTAAGSVYVSVLDTMPPVVNCPANYAIVTGALGSLLTRPGYSVSDASMINAPANVFPVTVVQSPLSTQLLAVNQSQVVTLTATDPAGLTASCTTTITALPPHFATQPPATQTFEGSASMPIDLSATAVDATNASLIVTNNAPGAYPVGLTTVTFSATDSGNPPQTVTATTTVTITDTAAPVITACAAPLTLTATGLGAVVLPSLLGSVTATDYSAFTVTQSPLANTTYLLGTLSTLVVPVTFTAKDALNNVSTCVTNVTIAFPPPHFTSVPGAQTIQAGQTPDLNATAVNATGVGVGVTNNAPTVFPMGSTLVTFTATDLAGQTATASVTITVIDTTIPVIGAHVPVTVEATSASGAVGGYTPPTVTDNLDAPKPATCAPLPTATFPFGITTVRCDATDASGNVAIQTSFVVTVQDTTVPVIAAHADVPAEATSANTTLVNYTRPTWVDPVDGQMTANCLPLSGSAFVLGNTTVRCDVTDAHGNAAVQTTFLVTVVDTTAPVIAPHADVTVAPTTPTSAVNVLYTAPTASDAVDGTRNATCTPASGSTFPLGDTIVTCRITDAHSNVATPTTFTVHVVDTTAPVVTVPGNLTREATGPNGAMVSYTATASDNTGSITPSCTPASGSTFQLTTTLVTCSATDSSGNKGTATFNVTVVDTTPPVVTVPGNMAVPSAGTTTTVTFTSSATDLVSGSVPTTCTPPSGSGFPVGPTTVTCTAADAANNVGTKSFVVTVGRDTTKPVVTVPANMTREATGPNGAAVTFVATALDNGAPLTPVVCTPASGSTFALGTKTVTCTATDASGNIGKARFTVTVVDTTPPVVTVPANITVPATSASGATVVYSPAPSATDVVTTGALPVLCTASSGSTFPIGTTTVTCGTVDRALNIGKATFTVTVVDNKAPVITACPAAVTIYTTAGTPTALPDLTRGVKATDYSAFTVTQSPAAGTMYTLTASQSSLAVPVTLTVTDASAAHNVATCATPTVVTFLKAVAPVCDAAVASPPVIWPPNHRFVDIDINGVTSTGGLAVTTVITSIFQDEPIQGLGDGDTAIDAVIANGDAQVRAERAGDGNGRVYYVNFTATTAGGSCTGTVTVSVPHDRAHAAVANGAKYDSTKSSSGNGDQCHGESDHGHHDGDGCNHGHHGHYDGDECDGRDNYHHDGDGHGGGKDGGSHRNRDR